MQTFSLNNQLGMLLKELRTKKGWSLRKAGDESGVSYSYISMLEKGIHSSTGKHSKVSPEQLKKLANAYEYPYNMLMIKAGYTESDLKDNQENELCNPTSDETPYSINYSATNVYTNYMDHFTDDAYLESLEQIILKEKVSEWKVASNIRTETIGDRLKALREKKGLTINELSAQLIGKKNMTGFISYQKYPPYFISQLEKDEIEATASFLLACSEFYSVSSDYLLTGYNKEKASQEYDDIDIEDLYSTHIKLSYMDNRSSSNLDREHVKDLIKSKKEIAASSENIDHIKPVTLNDINTKLDNLIYLTAQQNKFGLNEDIFIEPKDLKIKLKSEDNNNKSRA